MTGDEDLHLRMFRCVFVNRAQYRQSRDPIRVRFVEVLAAVPVIRHHHRAVEVEVDILHIQHQTLKALELEQVYNGGGAFEYLLGIARVELGAVFVVVRHREYRTRSSPETPTRLTAAVGEFY